MPDFNQYAAKTPFIKSELPQTGLSLIVEPMFNYQDRMPPITRNYKDDSADQFVQKSVVGQQIKDLDKLLGYTPMAPGASTSYNVAQRYDDGNILYLPGRDNEDLYAKNQGFWSSVGSGLGRFALTTGTKLGSGMGYLGGLVGIDNNSQAYGDKGFNAWIAGAGDNGLVQLMDGWEENVKNQMLPIYQEAADKNKGFFARAATDLNFWTEDVTDGAAFLASAFVPGMSISKLGIGARAVKGLAALRGIGYGTEAAALSAEGLTGVSEGLSLSASAAAQSANELQYVPRVISWIDNAKLARNTNVGVTSVVNTASEAMFEANDLKNTLIDQLSSQRNIDGSRTYTPEQVRILAAKGAKDSFVMNLGALAASNLWEANLFFKKLPVRGTEFTGRISTSGLLSNAELAKRTIGQRALELAKTVGEGVAAEGFWEENIQLAIQRLNSQPENFDLNFADKLGKLAQQYVTQTGKAIVGEDTEAAMNIGLGGLIGGLASVGFKGSEANKLQRGVEALNNQVSAFRSIGNIYQTNEDGSIKFENNQPVIDDVKIKSYVANMNKVLNMQEVARNMQQRGADYMAKIYQDEVFARFAKAHFDAGLGDVLYQKLNDIANISQEDLAMLGYDPSSKNMSTQDQVQSYIDKAQKLQDLYDNTSQNFMVKGNRKKDARKQFAISDKLYYLSARSQSLAEANQGARQQYDQIKNDIDGYNESFNRASDQLVENYNTLWERVRAAQVQADEARYSDYSFFMGDMIAAADSETIKRQQELDEFVKNNEETLSKLKKDSQGRYMYEVNDKNYLPSAYELRRLDRIQAESELARNATLNVFARMSDPSYGEKYYDDVYSKSMEKEAIDNGAYNVDTEMEDDLEDVNRTLENQLPSRNKKGFAALNQDEAYNTWSNVRDNSPEDRQAFTNALQFEIDRLKQVDRNQITDEYLDETIDRSKVLRSFGDKEKVRNALKDELGIQDRSIEDTFSDLDELRQERDALQERNDLSVEEENRLNDLNNQIEFIENQQDQIFNETQNANIVNESDNIPAQDKEKVIKILNQIAKNKNRIVKEDGYYTVDGQRYEKVTTLIGDSIPESIRSKVQNAINAGNTIDSIVKAFFDNTINDEFRAQMLPNLSQEAFDSIIKQLDKIRTQLANKGIDIVASNVPVFDTENKIAGEIDLLGVDKNGNFKIYEIEARRPDVYGMIERQYGRGIKIMELNKKRTSAYRNLFANQYKSTPDEIAIQFPFQVSYDKKDSSGYITKVKLRDAMRLPYVNSVGVALDTFEPVRSGSMFNNVDLFRIFTDTFLPKDLLGKMQFLLRNVPMKEIQAKLTLRLKNAEQKFQDRYNQQQQLFGNSIADMRWNEEGLYSMPSDQMIAELNSFESNDAKIQHLIDKGLIQPFQINGQNYNYVKYNDRVIVNVKFGNLIIPYYISTGYAGKTDVPSAKWYPFFGISAMGGWLNKGRSNDINNFYNQPVLQKVAKVLNESLDTNKDNYEYQYSPSGKVTEFAESIIDYYQTLWSYGKPQENNTETAWSHILNTLEELNKEGVRINEQIKQSKSETNYTPTRYKGFTNLFALVGNKEYSLDYEGTTVGFMAPAPRLAYKDESGAFRILDHNTDLQTYVDVTGNVASTFPEFKRISRAYSDAYGKLNNLLAQSETGEVNLTNDQLKDLFTVGISYGELDLVPPGKPRTTLNDLVFNGIKVGNKQVTAVVNVDVNGNPQLAMDKTRRSKNTVLAYQKIDQWAANNMDAINAAIHDTNGTKVTENAAIIELPNGEYKVIALRLKVGETFNPAEQFIDKLGNKFTASTTPNVFKNETINLTPNYQADTFNIEINPDLITNEVYEAEDINQLEDKGVAPELFNEQNKTEHVNNFINSLTDEQRNTLNSLSLGSVDQILDAYQNSTWSSLDDYINDLKNCKL